MTNVKKQDFTRRIAGANSTDMIVILYDMTLTYIQDAKEALSYSDNEAFCAEISHIQGCIAELMSSLNMEYELARNLKELYKYCLRQLSVCSLKRDSEHLMDIIKVIEPLRNAYSEIAGNNTSGAIMGNSQEVYAGLTYGKNNLTESLSVQANRGFYI